MSLDEVRGLSTKIDELTHQLQLTESWLEGNENRMRTVITAIPVGLLITDEGGRIEALNPQCLKLFQCNYSDLDRRKIGEFFRTPASELFNNLNTNSQSQEVTALRPDGESFPSEIILRPFQTPNGQKVVVVVEDVTERKEIEQVLNLAKERLEQSEKRLVTMIANMPVGLAIISQDGTIEFSNSAMQKMFGKDDLLGGKLHEVLSMNNKQFTDILINKRTVECEIFQAFGEPLTVEVSATDITVLDQERFLIMLQDITSRHQLQRLRQEFVAMVTHDLRSPLTSIDISLLLIEDVLSKMDLSIPEVVMHSVENTRRSSHRLLGLVNDLLDYEKLESGTFSLCFGKTSVSVIVEQSLAEVQPIAEKRQIKILAPKQDFELEVDEGRIVQVIVNLLSNAIKFSEAGAVVTIAAASSDREIEIRIIDSGRGIPDNLKQVVFEKYKQIRSDDGRRGKGTGLGLPICKALIEGHNGEIGVVDSPHHGSTFWFRLPQCRSK